MTGRPRPDLVQTGGGKTEVPRSITFLLGMAAPPLRRRGGGTAAFLRYTLRL